MFRRWCEAALLILMAVQVAGCPGAAFLAGGAAGAGGVIWVKGKLEEQCNVPLAKVHDATIRALNDLELPVKEDKKDALTAKIRSELSDGKRVGIDMRSLSESSTRISIRVGTFGDKPKSRRLLEAIRRHL